MQLLLATENPGKKAELVAVLAKSNIECLLPSEFFDEPPTMPEESGDSFAENAFIKADFICRLSKKTTLADDSGLSVVSLNNFPGIKSARWLEGSSEDRCQGILKKMKNESNREAFFSCVLCLLDPTEPTPQYFEGVLEGTIAPEARGSIGFGYDYIFVPKGETKTLAELGIEYKNNYSHRAVALKKLTQYLKKFMVD